MSLDPILWAMKDAPVQDVEEWAVLSAMAETADEDGCNAFNSQGTLAERTRLSIRTVGRRQATLEERGLIRRGDQDAASKIPVDKRPVVYDLMIPYSWWGSKVSRVDSFRQKVGRPPLTPEMRPELPDALPVKERSDSGVSRSRTAKSDEVVTESGTTTSPIGPPVGSRYVPQSDNPPQYPPQEEQASDLDDRPPRQDGFPIDLDPPLAADVLHQEDQSNGYDQGDHLANGKGFTRAPDDLAKANRMWDAIVEACAYDPKRLTESVRKGVGKARRELLAVGAEPEQVIALAKTLRADWGPRYQITPATLTKYWPSFANESKPARCMDEAESFWRVTEPKVWDPETGQILPAPKPDFSSCEYGGSG